jgi:hypothetical protein
MSKPRPPGSRRGDVQVRACDVPAKELLLQYVLYNAELARRLGEAGIHETDESQTWYREFPSLRAGTLRTRSDEHVFHTGKALTQEFQRRYSGHPAYAELNRWMAAHGGDSVSHAEFALQEIIMVRTLWREVFAQ